MQRQLQEIEYLWLNWRSKLREIKGRAFECQMYDWDTVGEKYLS